jgi:hypothetical protein
MAGGVIEGGVRLPHLRCGAEFKLVATKGHDDFGKTLVGEAWELDVGQQS